MMLIRPVILSAALAYLVIQEAAAAPAKTNTLAISSLAELAKAGTQSDQTVKMKAGLYRLRDFIPLESIPARQKAMQWQFITFSGSNNTFDLTGVTIELDTAL